MAELNIETKRQSKLIELVKRMIMEQPHGDGGRDDHFNICYLPVFLRGGWRPTA